MIYILFMVVLGYGAQTTTQPFTNEKACEAAAIVYQQKLVGTGEENTSQVLTWCIPDQ